MHFIQTPFIYSNNAVLQPNAVSTTRPTIASSTDDDLDFELASNKLNSSGALSKRAPSSSRRVLDDATSSDDDFVSKETPTALASKQQQRRPSKCRPKMPQRQRKPPPRSSFVDDQCAVSDDADCSADEMLDGTAMLDGLICDADVDQTVNASMRAIYLQSIRYELYVAYVPAVLYMKLRFHTGVLAIRGVRIA